MNLLEEIAKHYISVVVPSDKFLSKNPVRDLDLLFPKFRKMVEECFDEFKLKKGYGVKLAETYRSNTLQARYFETGASKIKQNGMHHYAIAGDCLFEKFGYQGDYKTLREIFKKKGLTIIGVWDMGHVQFVSTGEQNKLRSAVKKEVMKFQTQHGLKIDGVAGRNTHNKAKEIYGNE